MKKKELPKVQPVKLKPVLGLKPGVWLTILYALVLVLFIFFAGILPDLVRSSKRVTFTSACYNASVYVDGNYTGGTPFTRKIESGNHSVEFKVNDVLLDNFEFTVSKPVFFAWLFPRKMEVSSSKLLTKTAYEALVSEFYQDVYDYSAILEYDSVHRYPNLFTEFAKTVSTSLDNCASYKEVLNNALCFVTSDEMKEDAKQAFEILNIPFEFDNSAYKPTYKAYSAPLAETKLAYKDFSITGYRTDSFCVSKICITEAMFREFIKENPYWAKENTETLISQNIVDAYYLADVNLSETASSVKPVVNVSYYAAKAFCDWLSQITGKSVVLPSEDMWMTAASAADTTYQRVLNPITNVSKPISMFGGVWELTDTSYVPNPSKAVTDIQSVLDSYGVITEVTVKGGSYVNESATITTRGSLPKNSCSDFMGFRVFWY